ncbi:hypothetical protein PVL29_016754 [Vitis rotundifolia]|nr:hypothetical protein PVL29_016754 [Vitis rotundifolia]
MLQLANIMHARGFSITIIHTHFNSPNPSNYPHFTFHSIPDGLLESQVSFSDAIALIGLLNINCVAPFQDCLSRLLLQTSEEPVACLVTDYLWHFTQAVANSLKLSRIVLRTNSAASSLAFAALLSLHERGCLSIKGPQLESPVPEIPPLKVKDLPKINTRDEEVFYQQIASAFREGRASSGIICNSFEGLEESELSRLHEHFRVPIFAIGPFQKYFSSSSSSLLAHDQSSITWLDKQAHRSVIYVSFGSIVEMDETEFLEMAFGLANSEQPFLWVVRPGLVRGSEWLESLPKGFLEMMSGRGHIVKWASQQEVLAHPATGGFWTHCGWNSTLESICEGVPMICLPGFGDQRVNARYASEVWKVGFLLENGWERGEIERTIRRLMAEEEGQERRRRVMHLKEMVNLSVKPGGSSHRSLERFVAQLL